MGGPLHQNTERESCVRLLASGMNAYTILLFSVEVNGGSLTKFDKPATAGGIHTNAEKNHNREVGPRAYRNRKELTENIRESEDHVMRGWS